MTQNTTHEKPELNTKFRPQDDFFSYVNSKWLAVHPIPESETRWGTFNVLRQQSWEAMRALYEDLQKGDYPEGSTEQQARDFYYTGMHFDELEAANMKPVEQFFKRIDAATNLKELSEVIGHLQSFDINGPWFTYVDSDHDDSSKHIFHIRQTGLTLPNRDYYLEDNAKMKEIRTAYETFVGEVQPEFPALGKDTKLWQTLFTFEHEIAKVSRSREEELQGTLALDSSRAGLRARVTFPV
jgi:putative endopeptidase